MQTICKYLNQSLKKMFNKIVANEYILSDNNQYIHIYTYIYIYKTNKKKTVYGQLCKTILTASKAKQNKN